MDNQRTKLTIKLLEDSLIKLLSTKTIFEISICELCDVAGINRSTFYRYFGSQFDLLSYMENQLIDNISKYFVIDEHTQSDEEINKQMINLLNYLKRNYDFTKLLLNNNVDSDFPNKLFELPCINSLIDRTVANNAKVGMAAYYRTFMITGGFNVLKLWVNEGCTIKPEIIAKILNDFATKIQ